MLIYYWNVHGLNEEKLEEIAYITSSCKYDIICLSETITGESACNLPGYSLPYIVKPLKLEKGVDLLVECLYLLNLFIERALLF
jgi:hypothetical protein